MRRAALTAFSLFAAIHVSPAYGQAPSEIRVIVDASGSMAGKTASGEQKMAVAVFSARKYIEDAPPSSVVEVTAFGADPANQCGVASKVLERVTRSTITSAQYRSLESLRPAGSSPIVASVEQAIRSFEGRRGEIVLVSDGTESCGRNICEISNALEQNSNVSIRLIPIGISPEKFDELGCIFPKSQVPSPAAARTSDSQVSSHAAEGKVGGAFLGLPLETWIPLIALIGGLVGWMVRQIQAWWNGRLTRGEAKDIDSLITKLANLQGDFTAKRTKFDGEKNNQGPVREFFASYYGPIEDEIREIHSEMIRMRRVSKLYADHASDMLRDYQIEKEGYLNGDQKRFRRVTEERLKGIMEFMISALKDARRGK